MNPATVVRNLTPTSTALVSFHDAVVGAAEVGQIVHGQLEDDELLVVAVAMLE